MRIELEKKLVKKYPNLYQDYKHNPNVTGLAFGFECGDGWFEIIDELSSKLEPLDVIALQVKEKFGGLRFYISSGPDYAYNLIDEAEEKSLRTCERCGKPGTVRSDGWLITLCDECYTNKNWRTWEIK